MQHLKATFTNLKNDLNTGLFVRVKINSLVYKNAINIPQSSLLDATGTFVMLQKRIKL